MNVTAINEGIGLLIQTATQLPISQNESIERAAIQEISNVKKRKNASGWTRCFSATLKNAYGPKELDFRVWKAVNGRSLITYTRKDIANLIASSNWSLGNDFKLTETESDKQLIQKTYYEEKQKYADAIKKRMHDLGPEVTENEIYEYMDTRTKSRKLHRHWNEFKSS